jgi:hypothetical protein
MDRRAMNIDAIRLLIIGLLLYCSLVMLCITFLGYTMIGGRTFSTLIVHGKDMILVALGILGGLVTGHTIGGVERRKPEIKPEEKDNGTE